MVQACVCVGGGGGQTCGVYTDSIVFNVHPQLAGGVFSHTSSRAMSSAVAEERSPFASAGSPRHGGTYGIMAPGPTGGVGADRDERRRLIYLLGSAPCSRHIAASSLAKRMRGGCAVSNAVTEFEIVVEETEMFGD